MIAEILGVIKLAVVAEIALAYGCRWLYKDMNVFDRPEFHLLHFI